MSVFLRRARAMHAVRNESGEGESAKNRPRRAVRNAKAWPETCDRFG